MWRTSVVALALLAACSHPTGVVIHLESDITGGFESLDSTRLTLRYGDPAAPIVDQISYDRPGDPQHPIPGNLPIYALDPEETRTLDVLIETGLNGDRPRVGAAAISEHFVVRLRPHHMLRLDVHLDAECIERECLPGYTCGAGGTCVLSDQGQCDFNSTCHEDVMTVDVPVVSLDATPMDVDPPADVQPGMDTVDVVMDTPVRDMAVMDQGPQDVSIDRGVLDTGVDSGPIDVGFPDAGCTTGTMQCGAGCVSSIDPMNCTACGHACAEVETCSGSGCIARVCSSGSVHCPADPIGTCRATGNTGSTCSTLCPSASCTAGYTCVEPRAGSRAFACCATGRACTAGEVTPVGTSDCCR